MSRYPAHDAVPVAILACFPNRSLPWEACVWTRDRPIATTAKL